MTALLVLIAFLAGTVIGVWLPSGFLSPSLTYRLALEKAKVAWRIWRRK